ncbi:endonuclease [Campylobacter sp. US33a]|uniref:endonuclease n=1 Tax=Campylobacter sp. US33a TaxID=2498120 RepID=UPI001068CD7B|nr:endonuclease [Campylobacter sp. US33a]TEY01267.1 deoxyribonuclease [Campylobacter sp. US33a]
MNKILMFLTLMLSFCLAKSDGVIDNFEEAKEFLSEFYIKNPQFMQDFYCDTSFKAVKKGDDIRFELIKDDSYTPRHAYTKKGKINQRAKRIEWEHIMSAHNFGKHLPCWKEGGRKACKDDKLFNKMEGDIQNLVPAIGEINGDRSNFNYAQAPLNLKYNQYGKCKVYTDFKARKFYPNESQKGWIARSYLYMSEKYKIRLSNQQKKLFEVWKKYPMSLEEKRIRALL